MNKVLLAVVLVMFIVSCGGAKPAPRKDCVPEKMKNIVIRWGDYSKEHDSFSGYTLKTDSKIYKSKKELNDKDFSEEYVCSISPEKYCEIYFIANRSVLAAPPLYAPGPQNYFIVIEDNASHFKLLSAWNSQYRNQGNVKYFELYDSLSISLKRALDSKK